MGDSERDEASGMDQLDPDAARSGAPAQEAGARAAGHTTSVLLSPLSEADAPEWMAAVAASRPLHRPWVDPPGDPDRFAAYLARSRRDTHRVVVVRHATCGRLAGWVSINDIVRGAFQSATVGYGAFAGHARRGLMTAGLAAVCDQAFGPERLHRLEANIQPANAASLALARRLGFRREGYSPRYLLVDGDWRDHERWAVLAEDWHRLRTRKSAQPGAGGDDP